MVEFYDLATKQNISYHIDKRLLKLLEKVKQRITQKDKDEVWIGDGYEGSGKSTFFQQVGKYVDPTLNLDRICMTADEFRQAIYKAEKGQCVIYDEAVTGMSSGDSISKIGKLLKSLMMQMRQKNLFVIVIIPSVFELNKYAVMSRARKFFHIYENKGRMGYFVGYNRKHLRLLYLKGKKTYSYRVKSFFNGRFYGKYVVDEEAYRKKKDDALSLLDDDNEEVKGNVNQYEMWKKQRDYYIIKEYLTGQSIRDIESELKEKNCPLSRATIGEIVKKYTQSTAKLVECPSVRT